MNLKEITAWAAAGFALLAAGLWYYASIVNVPPQQTTAENGWKDFEIIVSEKGKESDFFPTSKAQLRWNRRAALASAIAAFFQAAYLILPDVQ